LSKRRRVWSTNRKKARPREKQGGRRDIRKKSDRYPIPGEQKRNHTKKGLCGN